MLTMWSLMQIKLGPCAFYDAGTKMKKKENMEFHSLNSQRLLMSNSVPQKEKGLRFIKE